MIFIEKYLVYFEFEYEIDPPLKETFDKLFTFIRETVIHTLKRQLAKLENVSEDIALEKINEKYEFISSIEKGATDNEKFFRLMPKGEYTREEIQKDWKLFSLTEVFMRPELGIPMFSNPDEVHEFTLEFPKGIGEIYKNGHLRIKRIR